MKTLIKIVGFSFLTVIVIFFVLFSIAFQSLSKRTEVSSPIPKPSISAELIDDMAQRYVDSHKELQGKHLSLKEAKTAMKGCLTLLEDKTDCERIIDKQFWIGMNKSWAVISLGDPNDINKTVTGNLVREQWVYGDPIYGATYLYFDNDVLTSYQN